MCQDMRGKNIGIFLVSAYAPIGVATNNIWKDFLGNLERCIRNKPKSDILLIGCDCNSYLGICYGRNLMKKNQPLGSSVYHIAMVQVFAFLTLFETINLVTITTYFRKRKYTTWSHPNSKLPHQIDHFISQKPNFCRFIDASVRQPILNSDHLAINCKLKIMANFKKACKCNPLRKLDSDLLIDDINLNNEFKSCYS